MTTTSGGCCSDCNARSSQAVARGALTASGEGLHHECRVVLGRAFLALASNERSRGSQLRWLRRAWALRGVGR